MENISSWQFILKSQTKTTSCSIQLIWNDMVWRFHIYHTWPQNTITQLTICLPHRCYSQPLLNTLSAVYSAQTQTDTCILRLTYTMVSGLVWGLNNAVSNFVLSVPRLSLLACKFENLPPKNPSFCLLFIMLLFLLLAGMVGFLLKYGHVRIPNICTLLHTHIHTMAEQEKIQVVQ